MEKIMYKKLVIFIFLIFSSSLSNKLNADYFKNVKPKDSTEFYLYGGSIGTSSTLCDLFANSIISYSDVEEFKKNYLDAFRDNQRWSYVVTEAFNDGLSEMRKQGDAYKNCYF